VSVTDEQLLALSDASLDEAAANEVRRMIETDPGAVERLRLLLAGGDALRNVPAPSDEGLEALTNAIRVGTLIPASDASVGSAKRARQSRGEFEAYSSPSFAPMRIAACAALVAFGLAAGYAAGQWSGSTRSDVSGAQANAALPIWVIRVVDYHTLYARETVAPSTANAQQRESLRNTFEAALKTVMHIPALRSRGLEFRRGQVLKFKDAPVIQLAYLPDIEGTPVALCLRTTEKADSPPQFARSRGMGVVRWRQNGLSYVLVGHRSEEKLIRDARMAVKEIAAAGTI